MLEAKSMYFGGDIINASECDYSTSREFGLVCPFCSSAVFIRSESVRQRGGKMQLVRPYFAHYPSGAPDNWDCEKRSHTKQGEEEIERIKIQAKNQRLRLYNAHLWSMFADYHGIKQQHLNQARKLFGEKWCEQHSIFIRHEWAKALPDVYDFIDLSLKDLKVTIEDGGNSEHHLLKCDLRLHRAICTEIADFLATNSAGFVFAKMFKFALLQSVGVSKEWGVSQAKAVSAIAHISSMSIAIAATNWIEQISKHRND